MPDWNRRNNWNQAKTISIIDVSRTCTNHIWSENRKIYGYKDLSQFHLMTTFYGTPFIDVRIDFNSWLPNTLPDNLSKNNKFLFKNF